MYISDLIKTLEGYAKTHRLYDYDNPEFYLSSVKYNEDEDRLYVFFEEEER